MQSCACPPRQTLAERINAIIAKYERNCPSQQRNWTPSYPPKICTSSPCFQRSSCSPCSPCPLPCPVYNATSSCCPKTSVLPQPCPGPGLTRYISKRDLCPALKGCLSLYKRPSVIPPTVTCAQKPSCYCPTTCPTSNLNCCPITGRNFSNFPANSTCKSPSSGANGTSLSCFSQNPSRNFCKSDCPNFHQRSARPPCVALKKPNPCGMENAKITRKKESTSCCSCATTRSTGSSFSPPRNENCCNTLCPAKRKASKKRLTAFDDPPYASYNLEREFSSRFIRLDSCYCETDDSSSSLENESRCG